MAAEQQLITVIGRGHSGTRILSHTLYASGVFMGETLTSRGDTVPPYDMYQACRIIGKHVSWAGGFSWDFSQLHSMPVDPDFEESVRSYLLPILNSGRPNRGWKLPETTLVYPWLARMFPQVKYIHIVRDPRDGLLKPHLTDGLAKGNIPCPEPEDELARRVVSWKYQHEIVKATPEPEHFMTVKFEDLVLDQEATLQKLEGFLGIPLARIVMDPTRVGQWETDQRLLPFVAPLVDDMRELGYDVPSIHSASQGDATPSFESSSPSAR